VLGFIGQLSPAIEPSVALVQTMAVLGIRLNLILVIFNILPFPPLDGSHVVKHFLPPRMGAYYLRYGGVAFLALILSMWIDPRPVRILLSPALGTSEWVIDALSGSMLPSMGQALR
jgi:Zn-dependent protease